MFTGLVKGIFPIVSVKKKESMQYAVSLSLELMDNLEIGASVSVNGVCQTVVRIEGDRAYFDAIDETVRVTTLKSLQEGSLVNIERSLKVGDEVGGHFLSGHVIDTVKLIDKEIKGGETVFRFNVSERLKKYIFEKGFVAIDGVSLTVACADPLTVHLIPETLKMTILDLKQPGDQANIEIDYQTKAIVDTVERFQSKKKHS